jgi:phospholipid/cholesterol/gamma-HCH transport system ATP-binding protein
MSVTNQNKKIIIEIKDLKKSFGDNHVLNGFNMVLHEGENLVIMGNPVLVNP